MKTSAADKVSANSTLPLPFANGRFRLKFVLCWLSLVFFSHEALADKVVACSGGCDGALLIRDDGSSFCYMRLPSMLGKMHPGQGGSVTIPLKVTAALSREAALKQPGWDTVRIDLPRGGQVSSKELDQATQAVVKYYNATHKEAKAGIAIQVNIKASSQTGPISKTSRGGETIWISQSKSVGGAVSLGQGKFPEFCGMP